MIKSFGLSVKGEDHLENEDAFLLDDSRRIYAVADGVSIPSGGKQASLFCIKNIGKTHSKKIEERIVELNKKLIEFRKTKWIGYSTLTVLNIKEKFAEVVNVGDSPAFLVRNGEIKLLTTIDRSFEGHLLQAMGNENIDVHIKNIKLKQNDLIILMTDGISDLLSEKEILKISTEHKTPENIAKNIINEVLKKETYYNDDKTIVVVKHE